MDDDLREALAILDAMAARAAARGPCVPDEAYWNALRLVEALPENQDGADKTWVGELVDGARHHFRDARRI